MEGLDIQQIVRTAIEEYLQARPEGSEDVMRMASIMAREALERAARQIMPPSAKDPPGKLVAHRFGDGGLEHPREP
jgi:hypothetical protein